MYTPDRHYASFYIAGFQYHDGTQVLSKLKPGTKLKLVAEPDNPYDPNAVAIFRKGTHLGYVPQNLNDTLSQLLVLGHADVFEAYVSSVAPEELPYKQVYATIKVKDAN